MRPPAPSPAPIRWAAQLAHVREVSLHGHADLAYWTDRLAPEQLAPAAGDGRAHLLVVCAAARFHGVAFRELSVSVVVAPSAGSDVPDAAFLLRAYNSNRFFAWCERAFFSTPYAHADVRVEAAAPASVELLHHGRPLLRAAMSAPADGSRPAASRAPGGFAGVVHLPRRSPAAPRRQFIARIAGDTETHPFLPADTLSLNPAPAADGNPDAIRSLLDSHFTPTHWELRPDANHAKSKTYPRPAPPVPPTNHTH